jgi:ribose transport system substrate-binding protein
VKILPIAIAAVWAVLLAGGIAGAAPGPVAAAPAPGPVGAAPAPGPVRVGVVLKALDNPFFVAIYEGVRGEARRLDVRASVRAATSSSDLAGQAGQVRTIVAQGNDCYVINPITTTNLVPALRGVRRPIVNIDSPIDRAAAERAGVRIQTYIGTNDVAAGSLAGATMASLLDRGGEVALLRGTPGSVNSDRRASGFERRIRGTRLRLVVRVDADYDRAQAQIATERILRDHPRLSGFFAVNDLMALGVADAVRAAGKAGRVKIIGLDGIAEALDAVRAGSISATISQYPYVMGQMGIEACVAAGRGVRLPARVAAPIALVTRDNVARATAAFPRPFRAYPDPFRRLLSRRG